jgi:indole-3-glycerol phosphate synthase
VALIAEIKRRAPSAGELDRDLVAEELARTYELAGAAALSVLTDSDFGGELADLTRARNAVALPALRKDFVLDPAQIWESRVAAADAVLLIVRAVDDRRLGELLAIASEAGLGTLVEVHDEEELGRAIASGAPVLGINNRDLRTLATGLGLTRRLASAVPGDRVLVAESGIDSGEQVRDLGARGVDAVLVGSALVRHDEPGRLAAELAGQPRVPRS